MWKVISFIGLIQISNCFIIQVPDEFNRIQRIQTKKAFRPSPILTNGENEDGWHPIKQDNRAIKIFRPREPKSLDILRPRNPKSLDNSLAITNFEVLPKFIPAFSSYKASDENFNYYTNSNDFRQDDLPYFSPMEKTKTSSKLMDDSLGLYQNDKKFRPIKKNESYITSPYVRASLGKKPPSTATIRHYPEMRKRYNLL